MLSRSLKQALGSGSVVLAAGIVALSIMGWAVWLDRLRLGAVEWALIAAAALALALILRKLVLEMCRRIERQQAEQDLRFSTAINHISQGLCFFDGQQRLIVCNRRYAEIYGLTPDQVEPGTTLDEIVDHRLKTRSPVTMSKAEYLSWRKSIQALDKPSDTEVELRDGRRILIHHEPMPDGGWVATHEDVTHVRRAFRQVQQMALTDALTGLWNRLHFHEQLTTQLRQRPGDASCAVLLIDLDRFKVVNDNRGHAAGDAVLMAAASRLLRVAEPHDLVARLGGDEFAILQRPSTTPWAATALAERLVDAFKAPIPFEGEDLRVSASVGVVVALPGCRDGDALMRRADRALYAAKAAGRDTWRSDDVEAAGGSPAAVSGRSERS